MSLVIATTQDQALLALVIKKSQEAAQARGAFVGRTALQKLLYFLKVLGVPMNYRFDIYNYGPFCAEIMSDAEVLLADDVIVDSSNDRNKYSNYAPGRCCAELLDGHAGFVGKVEDKVSKVAKALAPLRPEHLELLATLHYAHRWVRASGGKGPWRRKTIRRFEEIKGERFSSQQVNSGYDALVGAGLLSR